MFQNFWLFLRKLVIVVGCALSFLIVVELFRIFAMFHRFHPWLGYGFLAVLLVLLVLAYFYIRKAWFSLPRTLTPPPLPEPGKATHREMDLFCRYMARYLDRLSVNSSLPEERQAFAAENAADIREILASHPLNEDLVETIRKTDEEVIRPLLRELEARASIEVRSCVRDVMLGVTLSPYHTVDILVVVYRNVKMVLGIARTFAGRPPAREQFNILIDTMKVVATVNFINMGRNLLESLFSRVPFVGRVLDDIGEGLGAGFFTSASGNAAIYRCAAYQGWDREEATQTMLQRTRRFFEDVRDIFVKDVFPDLKGRIRTSAPPEKVEEPGFWDGVAKGIGGAIDATAKAVGDFVIQPAKAGTQQVVRAGVSVSQSMIRAGTFYDRPGDPADDPPSTGNEASPPAHRRRRRRKHRSRGIRRLGRNVVQRFRYSGLFGGPR